MNDFLVCCSDAAGHAAALHILDEAVNLAPLPKLAMQKSKRSRFVRLNLEQLEHRQLLAALEFQDPNPSVGNGFATQVRALSSGNVVVTSPFDDAGGPDAGAIYLFDGESGALISTLTGGSANDRIGQGSLYSLVNGNFVVRSPAWDNGSIADAGAVTWGSGVTGVSGVVGPANSLVGTHTNDFVSGSVALLPNGNFVTSAPDWDNGTAVNAGAVTWGNGGDGSIGVVGVANSLVGTRSGDRVGTFGVSTVGDSNYLTRSPNWDNGGIIDAGAVTWGNGATGTFGEVSALNSLVGTTYQDSVGSQLTRLRTKRRITSTIESWLRRAAR